MKKIISFLVTILAFCGIVNGQELSPKAFEKAISASEVQLLDVRTAEEYSNGYIGNAMQADWNNQEQFKERIAALDKTKPVYVYCLGGGRSAGAQAWMLKNGFTNVTNLKGGINAWNAEKLSITVEMQPALFDLDGALKSYTKDQKVLVDISATWCPPCRKMQPIVDELKNEFYDVVEVDGGSQTQICTKYNVEAFPTFIVFQNGKEIARKQGVVTKEELIGLMK